MAKFFAVDANGLNIIFSGSDVTFVNPHCEKNNSIKKSIDYSNFSQQETAETEMIGLTGNCTSPFQFVLFSWELNDSDLIAVFDDHFTSRLNYRYLDNVSPPPRLA